LATENVMTASYHSSVEDEVKL